MTPQECPYCKTDLRGGMIPASWYPDGQASETAEYFSAVIGIEVRGVYDGVLFWQCPSCEGRWHRWPSGHRFFDRADPYVRGEK